MTNKEAIANIEYARKWLGSESDFSEEALDMAIAALEKQDAKQANMSWDINFGKVRPHCPVCGESNPMMAKYCFNCGQHIKVEKKIMTECMNFPATVEEFMEQYKVTDYKQVYTNGIELVPIFRMKQWFEHQPTTDVTPVVHGRWIRHWKARDTLWGYCEDMFECSKCGVWKEDDSDFCPDCGAKMDGEE